MAEAVRFLFPPGEYCNHGTAFSLDSTVIMVTGPPLISETTHFLANSDSCCHGVEFFETAALGGVSYGSNCSRIRRLRNILERSAIHCNLVNRRRRANE